MIRHKSARPPRVSIGLPVYNGEEFLEPTLQSILTQTYQDYELIISDDGSTDRTEAICRRYAAGEPRIRYYRSSRNHGASWNHNRVFEWSAGEYFKWTSHDDLCAPDFLERCVRVLDSDLSVVLCHTKTHFIDELGRRTDAYDLPMDTDSPSVRTRFRELVLKPHWTFQIFGVIRAAALRRTPLFGAFSSADRILLVRLGLLGRFHQIPEYLFFYREHPGQSTRRLGTRFARAPWYEPGLAGRIILPEWRVLFEYVTALRKSSLGWWDRAQGYGDLILWTAVNRNWARLALDLLRAARMVLRRSGSVTPMHRAGTE